MSEELNHEWDNGRFGFVCCKVCGFIKREDGRNKPCKGPVKMRPLEKSTPYFGHMTLTDGSHVPLSEQQAREIWDAAEAAQKARAEKLPDEESALVAMNEAFERLKELGWAEAMYCPKDGSVFDAIEAGSTGIHRCHYEGKWPDGRWWIADGGDLWPSRPILYRREKTIPPQT